MATYPTTPTTLTLASAFAGSILKNYRDGGFTQGTAVVRDVNRPFQSVEVQRIGRKIDFKTVSTLSVAGVQTALVTTDVLQVLPVSTGDVIQNGTLRVIRAASAGATATITVQVGATALSSTINFLATGITAVNTATPFAVTADDTVDFVLTGTTSPVFDGLVELVLSIMPTRN
jgi:hypothetical protein